MKWFCQRKENRQSPLNRINCLKCTQTNVFCTHLIGEMIPVCFSLISVIDYRYFCWCFGLQCYRNVVCRVMPELKIVAASFKVESLVLDSSAAQFQHHYSFESWERFGSVLSSVLWKKSLRCLLNSWSHQGLKGQCRTLGLPSCGGSSWCVQIGFRGALPLCAICARPVAVIPWLKVGDVKPTVSAIQVIRGQRITMCWEYC